MSMKYVAVAAVLVECVACQPAARPDAGARHDAAEADAGATDAAPTDSARGDVGSPAEQLTALDQRYCQEIAAWLCAEGARCGCDALPTWPGDVEACQTERVERCGEAIEPFRQDILAGQLFVDPAAIDRCVAELEATTGTCALVNDFATRSACLPMLATADSIGAPCDFSVCAMGQGFCDDQGRCRPVPGAGEPCQLICRLPASCVEGTCVVLAPEGEGCAYDSDCRPPLRCRSRACRPLAERDETCAETVDCRAGLRCVAQRCADAAETCDTDGESCGNLGGCLAPLSRSCKERVGVGSPCDRDAACAAGSWCDEAGDGTCRAHAGTGETCSDGVYCAEGLACDFMSGLCGPIPSDGEPCALGELGPMVCGPDLACADGVCGPLPGLGEPCAGVNACAPGLGCDFAPSGSVCVERVSAGQTCSNDTMCADGTFCNFHELVCRPFFDAGTICHDGNECGPGRTCAPDAGGDFVCQVLPGLDQPCFFDCAGDLACLQLAGQGLCAPEVCRSFGG